MRILFLSWRDRSHPQAGGSEYVVDRLARGLQGDGHDVALVCGGPIGTQPYPVHDAGGTYGHYLRLPFVARRRFPRPDVVIDVENGISYFSPLWQRAPVVCLVHHVHVDQWRMYFPAPLAWVGRFLERRVMPRVYRRCAFVAVSASTASDLVEIGIDAERIHTIEMGSDPVEASTAVSPTPLFVALGRLVPHKRIGRLLELWERVRDSTGGRLVIVGDGPEADALRTAAGPGVEFTGAIGEDEKRRLLSEAWLLVHPAAHEGWGTVVMEAAALGTPAVAYDVRGVRDSVVTGETGVLAADDDEFAAAWIGLARDQRERERLAATARVRARGFTWERAVAELERVAREVVA